MTPMNDSLFLALVFTAFSWAASAQEETYPQEQPQVEQPPEEQPPMEQPPAEEPQAEQPPAEEPQAAQPVEQPMEEQPQAQQPATQRPATEITPIEETPAAQSPTQQPPAQQPAAQQLPPRQPEAQQPLGKQPPEVQLPMEVPPEGESGFAWLSIAPEIGFAYYPKAEITVKGYPLEVEPRKSFVIKAHLDIGGDGAALELAPFIGVESAGTDFSNITVDPNLGIGGGLGGQYVAIGGEAGLVYRFTVKTFYPHVGFGFHGAYLTSDAIDYGAELHGRIPIGFTWYIIKHLGLVVEMNLMYGVTGIRGKATDVMEELKAKFEKKYENFDKENFDPENPPEDMNPEDQQAALQGMIETKLAETIKFGAGFAFDLLIGLRFP